MKNFFPFLIVCVVLYLFFHVILSVINNHLKKADESENTSSLKSNIKRLVLLIVSAVSALFILIMSDLIKDYVKASLDFGAETAVPEGGENVSPEEENIDGSDTAKDYLDPFENGLIAKFTFENNLVEQINGVYGEANGNPDFIEGVQGTGILLSGQNDYISYGAGYNLPPLSTVNIWLYLDNPDTYEADKDYNFFAKYDTPKYGAYAFSINNQKIRVWTNYAQDKPYIVSSTNTLPSNKWTMVTITNDMNNVRIYIDGILDAEKGDAPAYPQNNDIVQIGNQKLQDGVNNTRVFHGQIDELYLYDRVLELKEIQDLYAQLN